MKTAICIVRDGTPAFRKRLAMIANRGEATDGRTEARVRKIVDRVRLEGDSALLALTKRFDGISLVGGIEVPVEELKRAEASLDRTTRADLRRAARRIATFHRRQRSKSWSYRDTSGLVLGQKIEPLERVGVYVPGGLAAYPSSVLMNVIPAKIAGVGEVIAVSPPAPAEGNALAVLAAASISGVDRFFRVGGAQAIAALAFGTRSIPRVDKIVGPGNAYVQIAKRQVQALGRVGIDNFAGASEVLVVADKSANPAWVAADLLSQAEHDETASAVCVTDSVTIAKQVVAEVSRQLVTLPKAETVKRAFESFGGVFIVKSIDRAIEVANRIAPEHLELAIERPESRLADVRHAGAVFLGELAPEPIGDYLAGPNHVLPTGASARFGSPLGVYDFVKRTSVIRGSRRGLAELGPCAIRLARLEGLEAHARSVEVRGIS